MKLQNDHFNLLLGGGAALGYAHIGVLEYLHEKKLLPATYHGVSMGAIIAAVMALEGDFIRKRELFGEVFSSLSWIKLQIGGSLINTEKIEKMLFDIFDDRKISELPKELCIQATDYQSGKAILFGRENDVRVVDALLASMAVPALFPPHEIEERLYVDGYLSSNLPLMGITNDLPNLIVNVTGAKAFKKSSVDRLKELSILGNLERSIRILIYNQTHTALKHFQKPCILIEPELSDFKTSHFKKYEAIRQKGYEAAKEVLG